MKNIFLVMIILLFTVVSAFPVIGKNDTKTMNIENESFQISEDLKRKELELKERELRLKEKELELLNKTQNSRKNNKNLSELYKDLKKSIFTIYTIDYNEKIRQGTAFTVDKTGIALSNYHVFDNASNAIAINDYGNEFVINEIIDFNKDLDYFAFRLGPKNRDFSFLKIADRLPEIGEDCFAIGSPKALKNTISKGIISSIRQNGTLIQTDTAFTHGSSGGPLFNQNGEVIGITSSGIEGENINFAIYINSLPINKLHQLSRNTVSRRSESNITTFSASKYVKRYYTLIENQQFEQVISMFSDNIKRYYSKFNPTKNWVYKDMIAYRTKFKISSVRCDIDYNSIDFYESASGTYLINFDMDYKIQRIEKNKPSNFKLKLFMEVNNGNKIISIYEDIINKQ